MSFRDRVKALREATPVAAPAPVAPSTPVAAPAPVVPSIPVAAPTPIVPSTPVAAPAPVVPSIPVAAPAPVVPSIPVAAPTPVVPSIPVAAPTPVVPSIPEQLPTATPVLGEAEKAILMEHAKENIESIPTATVVPPEPTNMTDFIRERILAGDSNTQAYKAMRVKFGITDPNDTRGKTIPAVVRNDLKARGLVEGSSRSGSNVREKAKAVTYRKIAEEIAADNEELAVAFRAWVNERYPQ